MTNVVSPCAPSRRTKRGLRLTLAATMFSASTACSLITSVDGLGGGAGEPDSDASVETPPTRDATADATTPPDGGTTEAPCPRTTGGTMRPVGVGNERFCIDETEVTQASYETFLRARNGDVSGQSAACASNSTFGNFATECRFDPVANMDLPVRCADHCDALAFCAWAGKVLCGGPDGAPIAASANPNEDGGASAWTTACTGGDPARTFPYGTSELPGACNIGSEVNATPAAVRSHEKCEGAVSGVFDLVGNVREWENACDDNGFCAVRGGSYADKIGSCTSSVLVQPAAADPTIGFRCCAAVAPR